MFCDEALNAVEAIAAGEVAPAGRIGQHLATCPDCAAALAAARRIEELLQVRPVPRPSPQFTARTMARVRRARWRSDQLLDAGFNAAITIVVLSVVAVAWLFLNRSGLTSIGDEAVAAFRSAAMELAQRVAPAIPLYAGAMALLAAALGLWWWAERDAL